VTTTVPYNPERAPFNPERMLRWFEYAHLPAELQEVSRPFGDVARHLVVTLKAGPEHTVALRKLLEAKDAAVRAHLEGKP